jgi:DNA-binding transcriptional LysR family regulator
VTFSLRCDNNENLLSSLAQGSIDLALLDLTPEPGSKEPVNPLYYAAQTLLDQPVVMVCSKRYFNWNISGKIDFERLMQCEYLRTNNGSRVIDQWFQRHYKRLPHDLKYVLTTDNHQSCLDAVRNGMGLGVIPYHLVSRDVTAGTLSVIDSSGNQMISRLSLVQLKQKVPGLTEQAFVTVLKKELASLTSQNQPRPQNLLKDE